MNGQATITGTVARGSGHRIGSITAKAVAFGMMTASGLSALKTMKVCGSRTQEAGLRHWMNVTPTEPQELVWLVPQVGVDYKIETSTNLKWQIK